MKYKNKFFQILKIKIKILIKLINTKHKIKKIKQKQHLNTNPENSKSNTTYSQLKKLSHLLLY